MHCEEQCAELILCGQVIACACLFLAGKIEETPKALTVILKVVSSVRFASQPKELELVMVLKFPLPPVTCPNPSFNAQSAIVLSNSFACNSTDSLDQHPRKPHPEDEGRAKSARGPKHPLDESSDGWTCDGCRGCRMSCGSGC